MIITFLATLLLIIPAFLTLYDQVIVDSEVGVMFAGFYIIKWLFLSTPIFLSGLALWTIGISKNKSSKKIEFVMNRVIILISILWVFLLLVFIIFPK